jgi:hypothetical protein
MRLRPETRLRLDAAAKASNRSVSQEVEHRLRGTFGEDDDDIKRYGSKQNAAVVNLIGAAIRSASDRDSPKKKHDWLKEQWLFDDVMAAISHVLLWVSAWRRRWVASDQHGLWDSSGRSAHQ